MTEPNPYQPPAAELRPPEPAKRRKARLALYRDITFTTLLQTGLVMLMFPGDGGRWLSWAIPFVAVGNLLFGWLYAVVRGRSEEDPRGEPLLVLMVAGVVIFGLAVWGATFDFSAFWGSWLR